MNEIMLSLWSWEGTMAIKGNCSAVLWITGERSEWKCWSLLSKQELDPICTRHMNANTRTADRRLGLWGYQLRPNPYTGECSKNSKWQHSGGWSVAYPTVPMNFVWHFMFFCFIPDKRGTTKTHPDLKHRSSLKVFLYEYINLSIGSAISLMLMTCKVQVHRFT